MSVIIITHDLGVIAETCDDVLVMYAGRVAEYGSAVQIFSQPRHPYTQALLAAVPEPDPAFPLDFEALMSERASVPSAWPEPFTVNGQPSHLIDVGGGHFVRMNDDTEKQHALA